MVNNRQKHGKQSSQILIHIIKKRGKQNVKHSVDIDLHVEVTRGYGEVLKVTEFTTINQNPGSQVKDKLRVRSLAGALK
jgi:hypothetical protein